MEMGDWGGAPEQDYPAFDLHSELPTASNARRKAKRKRKQQQAAEEAQLNVPVRLSTHPGHPEAPVSKKSRAQPDAPDELHVTQALAQDCSNTEAVPGDAIPTSGDSSKKNAQPEQRKQHKKSRKTADTELETLDTSGSQPEEALSAADMAQLLELAQLARQHNPNTIDDSSDQALVASQTSSFKPPESKSVSVKPKAPVQPAEKRAKQVKLPNSATAQRKAQNQNLSPAVATVTPPALAKAETRKAAVKAETGAANPGAIEAAHAGTLATAADTAVLSYEATAGGKAAVDDSLADTDAAAQQGPDARAKTSKSGRKARLRLKRQLWRQKQQQQQQQQDGVDSDADAQPSMQAALTAEQVQSAAVLATPAETAAHKRARSPKPDLRPEPSQAEVITKPNSKQTAAALLRHASAQGQAVTGSDQGSKAAKTISNQDSASAGATGNLGQTRLLQKKSKAGLLDQMRSKLSGGRFRMLNEQLYTAPGQDAFAMMQSDPALFEQYHEGFREQTQHWPVQPIDLAVAWLKKQSSSWVVADFGCGDAQLASSVPQQVHSFDLVANRPEVTACNMADVPLGDGTVHVAIFCLALMGTDYGAFLKEAHRVLRSDGVLWIAEVRSRFATSNSAAAAGRQDFAEFVAALKAQGFQVTKQDASNKMFVLFVAKKKRQTSNTVRWPVLKPCLYKRR